MYSDHTGRDIKTNSSQKKFYIFLSKNSLRCKFQDGGYLNMTKNLEIFHLYYKLISNLILLESAYLSPRRTKKGGGEISVMIASYTYD